MKCKNCRAKMIELDLAYKGASDIYRCTSCKREILAGRVPHSVEFL